MRPSHALLSHLFSRRCSVTVAQYPSELTSRWLSSRLPVHRRPPPTAPSLLPVSREAAGRVELTLRPGRASLRPAWRPGWGHHGIPGLICLASGNLSPEEGPTRNLSTEYKEPLTGIQGTSHRKKGLQGTSQRNTTNLSTEEGPTTNLTRRSVSV